MDILENERKVISTTGDGWDHKTAVFLRTSGFTQDQIGIVLGLIAEHRQTADAQGVMRGFQSGFDAALKSKTPT